MSIFEKFKREPRIRNVTSKTVRHGIMYGAHLKAQAFYVNVITREICIFDSWAKWNRCYFKLSDNKFVQRAPADMRIATPQEIEQFRRAKRSKLEAVVS
jgi:hypothetical protein